MSGCPSIREKYPITNVLVGQKILFIAGLTKQQSKAILGEIELGGFVFSVNTYNVSLGIVLAFKISEQLIEETTYIFV